MLKAVCEVRKRGAVAAAPRFFLLAPTLATLLAAVAAGQTPPEVTVSGGADVSGKVYVWTVANETASPIVEIEFPHYRATLFFAPQGWTTDSTFLVNVGVADQPGVCRATAESPQRGIMRGGSGEFRMQIDGRGAQRGRGVVRVRLQDGRSLSIAGVELPVPVSRADKYVPLVGLGLIAAGALVVRSVVRRRRQPG